MKIKLCIMSAFLSVFLLFSSFSVKANEVTFPSFPLPVEGKSTTHYLIYYDEYEQTYYQIKPLDPSKIIFYIPVQESYGYRIKFNGSKAIIYSWKEGEKSWTKIKEVIEEDIFFNYYNFEDGEYRFIYSSFDLYNNYGNLFFRKAPIKANFLTQMREVEMGATMTTAVSLIPLLIPLLVFLMGFRKAWAWLSRVLRKA